MRIVTVALLSVAACGPAESRQPPGSGPATIDRDRAAWSPSASFAFFLTDDVAEDLNTDLVWERRAAAQAGHAAAAERCNALELDGESDWRLPTMIELLSLVRHDPVEPLFDAEAFPDMPAGKFWTASRVEPVGDGWFAVDFTDGTTNTETDDERHHARCVRAGSTRARTYDILDDGVWDRGTALVWERQAFGELDVAGAQAHCSDLARSGRGWRLPYVDELITLYIPGRAGFDDAAIDTKAFPGTPADAFWSADVAEDDASQWAVSFAGEFHGIFRLVLPEDPFYGPTSWVRCVRRQL